MSGSWERVCRVEELTPNQPTGRIVGNSGQDRDRVCVMARDNGEFVTLLDRCPHRDIPLSGGIVKDETLVCPGHFWRFDLATGERTDLPHRGATVYPTRVIEGWVEALLPPVKPRQPMREWLLAQAQEGKPTVHESRVRSPEIDKAVDVNGIRTNYHDLGSARPSS